MDQNQQMNESVLGQELDLQEIISLMLKKAWIVILVFILFAGAGFAFSNFVMEPMYQSTTKIYVMNKTDNSSVTYSDLQLGSQLTQDYMTLVKSRPVTEQIISKLNLPIGHNDLVNSLTVQNPSNTRILSITVEYNDPYLAQQIADEIRLASAKQIKAVMGIEQVNVVEEANLPGGPSAPNVVMNTAIAGVLGAMFAVMVIFINYIKDDTIKSTEDIEKYLGISVLSSIPVQKEINVRRINRKRQKKHKVRKNKNNVA